MDFFQTRNTPVAPSVFLRIQQMQEMLQNGITAPPLSNEMITYISLKQLNIHYFKEIFGKAFNLAYNKFTKHIKHHSALPLFKSIQCFNPQFICGDILKHNLSTYSDIFEFKNPSNQLINEWNTYCNMVENFGVSVGFDLEKYWKDKLYTLPVLSKIALVYIWIPVSAADVERSFSNYKHILDDRRRSLTEKNIARLNFLYFNEHDLSEDDVTDF